MVVRSTLYVQGEEKEQEDRMMEDRNDHGDSDDGTCCGVDWQMIRDTNSYAWHGYVLYNGNFSSDERGLLESKAHGDILFWRARSLICFDCAHNKYDYIADYNVTGSVFRDHDYVVTCLEGMCAVIAQTAGFEQANM